MGQHFKLTSREFYGNAHLFKVLEIESGQVVGKKYKELEEILKKRYKQLILVNHPDKGGSRNRFDQIYLAYQELKKYIEPLESGNPCVKVGVNAESDGRLTAREFHYRKKLFDTLGIGEEAIGKDFNKLISMLKKNDSLFYMSHNLQKYNEYLSKPSMRLFLYISPLQQKKNLIEEDKKALALKFIVRKNVILPRIQIYSLLFLGLLTTVTILGSLLALAILIEVLAPVFSKGCEIYAEKHTKDLLEEDPRDRVQKETDLLEPVLKRNEEESTMR